MTVTTSPAPLAASAPAAAPRVGYMIGRSRLTGYAAWSTELLYRCVGANTGNLAFLSAVPEHVGNPLEHVGWGTPVERLRELDLIVFPAANQFGAHTDLGDLADRLLDAGVPVLVVGLGAQAGRGGRSEPTAGTVRWARALQELRAGSAPNILVRGRFTQEELARHGVTSTQVLGCPSLFLHRRPTLGATLAAAVAAGRPEVTGRARRVATVAGNSAWGWSAGLDRRLLDLARASGIGLPWVLQEGEQLMALARGEVVDAGAVRHLRQYFAPDLDDAAFADVVRSTAAVFADVDAWMEHLRRFDAVVGPRFHGVMLGLQAGTPGVVVAHDSRTAELATTTGVPHVLAADVEARGEAVLWEALDAFDGDAFAANRRARAITYVAALQAHGLTVEPWVGALRKDVSTSAS